METKWIPAGREKPPEDESVLITVNRKSGGAYVKTARYWVDSFGMEHWTTTTPAHVIAWMRLPEAYDPNDETCEDSMKRFRAITNELECMLDGEESAYIAGYAEAAESYNGRVSVAGDITTAIQIFANIAINIAGHLKDNAPHFLRKVAELMEEYDNEETAGAESDAR